MYLLIVFLVLNNIKIKKMEKIIKIRYIFITYGDLELILSMYIHIFEIFNLIERSA